MEISRVYNSLASKNRLYVPARAVREYGNNRTAMLCRLHQALLNRRKHPNTEAFYAPLLEGHEALPELAEAIKDMRAAYGKFVKASDKLLGAIREWQWTDPVSTLYRDVLNERIVDHDLSPEELSQDLDYRSTHRIPPGYKDANKPDQGIGDVAIWHTLLKLAKASKVDVVFVTDEKKSDWVVNDEQNVLGPRHELTYEFYHETGQSFTIVNFARFLEFVGAPESVVQEVEQKTPITTSISSRSETSGMLGTIQDSYIHDLRISSLKAVYASSKELITQAENLSNDLISPDPQTSFDHSHPFCVAVNSFNDHFQQNDLCNSDYGLNSAGRHVQSLANGIIKELQSLNMASDTTDTFAITSIRKLLRSLVGRIANFISAIRSLVMKE